MRLQLIMAGATFFRRSASLVLFLTFIRLLDSPKPNCGLANDRASITIALKADQREYPSRNLTLPRRSKDNGLPPSLKVKAGVNLLNITLAASYVLLLAGDVSSNPGPVKDPCGSCAKGCRSNQRAVQCDDCNVWHHANCIGM